MNKKRDKFYRSRSAHVRHILEHRNVAYANAKQFEKDWRERLRERVGEADRRCECAKK